MTLSYSYRIKIKSTVYFFRFFCQTKRPILVIFKFKNRATFYDGVLNILGRVKLGLICRTLKAFLFKPAPSSSSTIFFFFVTREETRAIASPKLFNRQFLSVLIQNEVNLSFFFAFLCKFVCSYTKETQFAERLKPISFLLSVSFTIRSDNDSFQPFVFLFK